MPRKGKCFSTCRTRPKTECVPPECHYTNGKKYKYCRLAFTRKMGPDCKPVLRIPKHSIRSNSKKRRLASPLSKIKPSKAEIREVLDQVIDQEDLVLPEPIRVPPHKKVKSELDLFSSQSDKFEKYLGRNTIGNLYYIYLFNKYKSKCITYDSNRANNLGLYLKIDENANDRKKIAFYEHMKLIAKQICKCVNGGMETFVIPFTFLFSEWVNTSHANLLIYRKVDNTIERFEPYGTSIGIKNDIIVEEKLGEFCAIMNEQFDKYKMPHIRFKSASEVCPYIRGLQTIEEENRKRDPNEGGGYCLAWSMFFAELVLNNPGVPSADLLDMVMQHVDKGKRGQTYLVNVIKGYAYHISTKLEKYYSLLFTGEDKSSDAIVSDNTNFYKAILNGDSETLAKFRAQVKYIIGLEMKMSIFPKFNPALETRTIRYELERERREEFPEQQHIRNLQMELGVYEKLELLKNPSPGREVVSPASKSKTTRKSRK